jgi:hypothetical protein
MYGLQAATLRVGNYEGEEVFTPFKSLLPMVDPNDFVIGGWDISGLNMAEAMERAKVRLHLVYHAQQPQAACMRVVGKHKQ